MLLWEFPAENEIFRRDMTSLRKSHKTFTFAENFIITVSVVRKLIPNWSTGCRNPISLPSTSPLVKCESSNTFEHNIVNSWVRKVALRCFISTQITYIRFPYWYGILKKSPRLGSNSRLPIRRCVKQTKTLQLYTPLPLIYKILVPMVKQR